MAAVEAAEVKALAVLEYKPIFGVKLQTPCDMSDDMVRFCIELAKEHLTPCLKSWQADGDGAVALMKEALDAKYGPSWGVIAGKHWGACITHDAKHFINFVLGKDINVTVSGRREGAEGAQLGGGGAAERRGSSAPLV
jgi:hypothetical protein